MTGHHNGEGVTTAGSSDRSHCSGIRNAVGDIFVAAQFTVWNVSEGIPDSLLKGSPFRPQREFKALSISSKEHSEHKSLRQHEDA